jgi:hypothetical protein
MRLNFIPKTNRKYLLIIALVALLALGDLALIIADQFFGEEKGRIFGYKIWDLIVQSNIKAIVLAIISYFSYKLVRFLKQNRVIKLPKFKKIKIKTRKLQLQDFIIPIVSIVVFIILVEFALFILLKIKNSKNDTFAMEIFDKNLYAADSLMGFKANTNLKARCKKVLINTTTHKVSSIFDVVYTTDSIGNRYIDMPDMKNRSKYALFFGCSFTFGIGVQDTENIPFCFAKSDTGYCVYNYGFTGYGPQNMLAAFKFGNIKQNVRQGSGICFYIYINSHVARAIGDKNVYTSYGKDLPYFDYQNDSLHYLGKFYKNRKFTSAFYSLMNSSNFIRYFNINFPAVQLDKHYKLTCEIIYQSYLEYKKLFHNDNFYVVLYPSHDDIKYYLTTYNIKVIDLSKAFNMNDKNYYLSEFDRHPTALADKLVTQQLITELNSLTLK